MTPLRRWLLGACAGWCAAGLMIGLAVPKVMDLLADPVAGPDEDYIRRMTETYGLSRDQQELLRTVLLARFVDQRNIYEAAARDDWDKLPPYMASQLRAAYQRAEQRVEALLDDYQRERFAKDRAAANPPRASGK